MGLPLLMLYLDAQLVGPNDLYVMFIGFNFGYGHGVTTSGMQLGFVPVAWCLNRTCILSDGNKGMSVART